MAKPAFQKGAKVKRWERNLDNPQAALKQIGALMVSESQRAFKAQQFGKTKWPPRAEVNVFGIIADFAEGKKSPPKRRFERRPALKDTGRLSSTIAFQIKGKDVVEVGSNLPYAGVHHHGGPVESKTITEEVQRLLGNWLFRVTGTARESQADRLAFLLNKKLIGKKLPGKVPARPFVGVTPRTIKDVKEAVGVKIFEAK